MLRVYLKTRMIYSTIIQCLSGKYKKYLKLLTSSVNQTNSNYSYNEPNLFDLSWCRLEYRTCQYYSFGRMFLDFDNFNFFSTIVRFLPRRLFLGLCFSTIHLFPNKETYSWPIISNTSSRYDNRTTKSKVYLFSTATFSKYDKDEKRDCCRAPPTCLFWVKKIFSFKIARIKEVKLKYCQVVK